MARFRLGRKVLWAVTPTGPDTIDAPNYKPVFLKLPFLIFFFLYVAALLGVLEYVCRGFPSSLERVDIPEYDKNGGGTVIIPTALLTAPLINPRHAQPVPTPAPTAMMARHTPPPRLKKGTPRHRFSRRQNNSTESVTMTNTTSIAAKVYADLDPEDAELFQPPNDFAGQQGFGPEFLKLLMPEALTGGNESQTLNGSDTHAARLRKRFPDPSKYGRLSGPTVGINYYVLFNDDTVSSSIWYERESSGRMFSSICEPIGDTRFSAGLVTCDGPALIFHDELCYNNWKELSALQQAQQSMGKPWDFLETLNDIAEPQFEGDIPFICGSNGEKSRVKSGVGLRSKEGTGSDGSGGGGVGGGGSGGGDGGSGSSGDAGIGGGGGSGTGRGNIETSGGTGLTPGQVEQYEEVTAPREITETLRDERGSVTATITAVVDYTRDPSGRLIPVSTRIRDLPGFTPTDKAFTSYKTNKLGSATNSFVTFGPGAPTTITLRDAQGRPTGLVTVGLPPPKLTRTYIGNDGLETTQIIDALQGARPTRTQPVFSPSHPPVVPLNANDMFHSLTATEYFLILFLPVSLGMICSIFSEMVYSEIRALLPFNQLIRSKGATAGFSLVMSTGGISGVVNSFRLLFQFKEPISILTDLLVLSSASITTLLSESAGIQLRGACTAQNSEGCFLGIGAFLLPSRGVQGLLGLNLAILLALCFLLYHWRSGVSMPPRSIMATAALMQNNELRQLFLRLGTVGEDGTALKQKEVAHRLQKEQFYLRTFHDPKQYGEDYGIIYKTRGIEPLTQTKTGLSRLKTGFSKITKSSSFETLTGKPRKFRDWLVYRQGASGNRLVDLIGLLYIWGLMILVIYYNAVPEVKSHPGLEDFMNEQHFGVRILFTVFGVALTFFWDHYYARSSMIEPYRQLWLHPKSAKESLMVSPCTSVFTGGLTGSLKRGEVWISLVGFTTIISKITPVLLGNIPFSPVQTWELHAVTAWTTVGCLAFMSLVLVYGFFFVKQPPMPIDPASLAGRMYYLCDSQVADEFTGMSKLDRKECEDRIPEEKRYRFGKMIGVSGELRIGVDSSYAVERAEEGENGGRVER